MIIVANVEVFNVPDNRYHQIACLPKEAINFDFESAYEYDAHKLITTAETVYPLTFINQRGERVRIGLDKQSQEVLGLCFEVFNNTKEENTRLFDALNQVTHASLWERFKWLFTGVK